MKIGERHLTIPEVHELLLKEQEKRELTYEQKLVAELEKIERVSAPLAHKIAELLPTHPDDVRSIFSKERFTLEEKTIASIMQTVGKYGAAATAPPSE